MPDVKYLWIRVLATACFSFASASAQTPGGVYIGTGQSEFAARQEAIRLALQEQVAQLVVADRAVSDTDVIFDNVVSTMNGYVETFDLLKVEVDGSGDYSVTARIAVSKELLKNHIASFFTEAGSIDGDGLFGFAQTRQAAQDAARMNAEANGYIFKRMFRGYPAQTFQTEVRNVSPYPSGPNQHLVTIEADISPDPAFVEFVKSTIDYLAYGSCGYDQFCNSWYRPKSRTLEACRNQECKDTWAKRKRLQSDYANAFPEEYDEARFSFTPYILCYHDGGERVPGELGRHRECFVLKPGSYKLIDGDSRFTPITGRRPMGVATKILDSTNRSVLFKGGCFKSQAYRLNDNEKLYWALSLPVISKRNIATGKEDATTFYVDLRPQAIHLTVDSRDMDLARANKVLMFPYIQTKHGDVTSVYRDTSVEDPCAHIAPTVAQ